LPEPRGLTSTRETALANIRKWERAVGIWQELVFHFFVRADGFIGHITDAALHAIVHAVVAG